MVRQGKEQKGADHVERTMGKVQHPQDAKDQRQAGGNQVDRHGNRHAVQKLDEEVRHPLVLSALPLLNSSSGPLDVSVQLPPWCGEPPRLRRG